MSHLGSKLKTLAGGTSAFAKNLEAIVDQKMAEQQAAQAAVVNTVTTALSAVESITADAKAGADALAAEIAQLTNQ